MVLALNAPVLWLPLTALAPVQPPDAVQAVVLVLLQVNVLALPTATDVGLTAKDMVGSEGGGGGATLLTVIATLVDDPTLPAASMAEALKLWLPFTALLVSQL